MAKSSIIEESKKAKGRGFFKSIFQKKVLIILAILIVLSGGAYYYFGKKTAPVAAAVQQTATVKRGDLQIAIQSDGKVVARDGVTLSFPSGSSSANAVVSNVYVKEGQKVVKGDKIASMQTNSLEFDLQNAYASYQSALANLQLKEAGATANDRALSKNSVTQAQLSLDQSKISLAQAQSSADQSVRNAQNAVTVAQNNLQLNSSEQTSAIVNNAYIDVANTLKSVNITIANSLQGADNVLGVDNKTVNSSFKDSLGALNPTTLNIAQQDYTIAKNDKNNFNSAMSSINSGSSQTDIDAAAAKATTALKSMGDLLNETKSTLDASVVSANFSQSQLNSLKSNIDSFNSSVLNANSSLTSGSQAIDSAKRSLNNFQLAYQKSLDDLASAKTAAAQSVANSNNNVANKVSSLNNAQLSYNQLIAPATSADLASARSQLSSASVNVDKAKFNIAQATIISPIDGVVSLLNYKTGDIISDNTKAVASIINNNTLYIEANIEEGDISKIAVDQKVKATFDAIDGLTVDGQVSFISLTSVTSSNGIVTYLVRVMFTNPKDNPIREGMTASVNFITADASNVLNIPVNAVRNVGGKPSVEIPGGTFVPVTTGFTDGKSVEIISGLNQGDKVIY